MPTLNNFATGGYLAGFNATIPESTVPEPHTLAMLLLGLSGIFIVRRQVSVVKNAGFAHIIRRSEGTP
ncbi:PEP-CTERM sorting domain-containing protein [Sedimenticola selenatireducens]|uniref:PEP-CTERM sorting domain-containing protein n=1 Tax=Sedimenticola selenatireducens TaxID=191960 RepID=UPI003AABC269